MKCCFILPAKELVYDCSLKKIPFPALETFEDRTKFPKRYFLFFDLFFRAGRHNRSLWKKAILENQGLNDKRFGPAIFEAHVRTTVRENYFKWIFQQLTDTDEVEDQAVEDFLMEYDEEVYTDLPSTLVCTHSDLTKFPFKNCEIDYGDFTGNKEEEEDDSDSDGSLKSVIEPVPSTSPNPASHGGGKKFFLVYKNVNANRFNEIREWQRENIKNVIEKTRDKHKEILSILKETIKNIREVKKKVPDTDTAHKEAIAEAKKKLQLFKDPYEQECEGPLRKKRRRSIENQTRFSDSKVTFFSKTNDEVKQEEHQGLRKSWEALYKIIWNKQLLAPKRAIIDVPIPQVHSIIRDMENDVNQLLADCAGMIEQV